MRKIILLLLIVSCAGLYSAKRIAGHCGFGIYNELPFTMKALYVNGFWFTDSEEFSIISEGVGIETSNFGKIIIRDISSIFYDENIFYASLTTDKSQLLYAVIGNETPTWKDVVFFDEKGFNSRFQIPKQDWIKIDEVSCVTILTRPLIENIILLLIFVTFLCTIYGPIKDKVARPE